MPYTPPLPDPSGYNLLKLLTSIPPALTVQTASVESATFETDATARSVRLEVLTGTATWAGIEFVPGEYREYSNSMGGVIAPITVTISSGSVRYEYAT
jgi:hypothetical protein